MKNLNKLAVAAAFLLVVGFTWGMFHKELTGDVVYSCDGKVLSLTTKIIVNDGEYNIEGNIFRLWEDPLTLSDNKGNTLGIAGDDYNIISQDDHYIKVRDNEIIMKGKISVFGEYYTIIKNGEEVAFADYNMFDTAGIIKDSEGNVISRYKSIVFMRDFKVSYNENPILSEEEVLLIHASYYSDKVFDK